MSENKNFDKIVLYDVNENLCKCWEKYFKKYINIGLVEVRNVDFKDLQFDSVVTAGNSYGWMTGGIDLAVREYYGQWIQDEIQYVILKNKNKCLAVGDSIIIYTDNVIKPKLIYAPTMDMPKTITKSDVFYVFSKLLEKYNSFACCGLGTLTGGLTNEECAESMLAAYEFIRNMKGIEV